jgi:MFS family permease
MGSAEKIPHNRQLALGSVFFVANALIWYFLAFDILQATVSKITTNFLLVLLIWSVHFGTIAISLLVGAVLISKVGRKQMFMLWTLLGVISPFALLALNFARVPITFLIAILFAVSLGLGITNCMQYFTQTTNTGSRGRYSGLIMLISGLGIFSLGLLVQGIELTILLLVAWRLIALFAVLIVKPFEHHEEKIANISYRSILGQRTFILYLIPWLMFSLVTYLSTPIQISIIGQQTVNNLTVIENGVIGLSAVGAGFLMDRVGRKQAAIAGFVLLGISFAFLGLDPTAMISWYLYTVFSGVTWGILLVLFVVCIWGELNQNATSDKYYAIGVLPFVISEFLSLILANYISVGSPYALFSFIAFFLFLAVVPLLYASETLPEKIMKDRELKGYIEKALEQVQKEADKNQKKGSAKTEKKNKKRKEEPEEFPGYEDARKLAEKYY